ncbi:MAG: ATPase [Spirochaetes bacterium GWF1_31_7]|nr:MAG: ATPase [Spirochaetes bacterium GWE1_32_154]OHD46565.1 MAG: ATPase [Spirochaetes bacterium GWF1_31_7]OHD49374.1 MAG: ATPase [Spirochaetes bacterium GWE2_31_10]OHD79055.1 MAG: ATPase [Spirochaetes bacterium RIFOXYB1_FULL_32_8]HBD93116.1 ATPase [Spirochaetia bacterium]
MDLQVQEIQTKVEKELPLIETLKNELKKVIVGQNEMLDGLLIGLITGGHILVEGVPGLAKTLAVSTLSKAVKLDFKRIQFTPDLLPSDIIGTLIYNQKTGDFQPKKGPVFANIILADEINRAPAKVQSALLESMQEKKVTLGDVTYALPSPFLVMATQNPIDQEGTYNLPEAQIDRFMMKIKITYPTKDEEKVILDRMISNKEISINQVIDQNKIIELSNLINDVYISDRIKSYIVDIVDSTRNPSEYGLKIQSLINYPASPRASIFLARAAKGIAILNGRGFVTADDIKNVSLMVLRHRLILSYEAEAEGVTSEDIIKQIFNSVVVP